MWEEIHGFRSPGEHRRFVQYIESQVEEGLAEEVHPDREYGRGELYGGRWFKHKSTGEIWRLVEPDFPFKGLWEPVVCGRYFCPCCGYRTLAEEPPGTFEVCPVCRWEDDNVQFDDPHYRGGANEVSLAEARENYRRFGTSDRRFVGLTRRPTEEERKSRRYLQ